MNLPTTDLGGVKQMKRKNIHRGGILSAGYDRDRRWLDVEFDGHRLMRVEGIGYEMAERFMHSEMPAHYWEEEIADNFSIREISKSESEEQNDKAAASKDALKRLFGDA